MTKSTLVYASSTALVVFAFAAGGVADLTHGPDMLAAMQHLGYPPYLLTVLGLWKVLGAIAVAVPRFPLLKEWAYAGFAFDLTGAAVSHAVVGDGVGGVAPPLILLALVAVSWTFRPASRRLAAARVSRAQQLPAGEDAMAV